VIKVLNVRLTALFTLEIDFSNHTQRVFDAVAYLTSRTGPRYWTSCETRRTSSVFLRMQAHCAGPMDWKFLQPKSTNYL